MSRAIDNTQWVVSLPYNKLTWISLLTESSSQSCQYFLTLSAQNLNNISIEFQWWDEERKRHAFYSVIGAWREHVSKDKRCSILLYFTWVMKKHQDFYVNVVTFREGNDIHTTSQGMRRVLHYLPSFKGTGATKANTAFRILTESVFGWGWENWHEPFPCLSQHFTSQEYRLLTCRESMWEKNGRGGVKKDWRKDLTAQRKKSEKG